MILNEETKVPLAALPVQTFKSHLRLGTGFGEEAVQEAVLEGYLRAALAAIERRTGKALITREFSCRIEAWRDACGQTLPLAPVRQVLEMSLIDVDDNLTIVPAERYRLAGDAQRPRIAPRGTQLPTIPTGGYAEVFFLAGYGETWGDLPADLAQAVMMLASHYYEYRDQSAGGADAFPFGVSGLIERFRTVRAFGRIGA